MGILSRFKEIMASNVNALLEKNEDPQMTINTYMKGLQSDLGQVRSETASALAEERRTKRALDECQDEMAKLQRYAEKSVEAGNERDAMKFLEKKAPLTEKEAKLHAEFDAAAAKVADMKRMEDKLVLDIEQLEARRAKLSEKMDAAKEQQRRNALSSPTGGGIDAAFAAMEEKADNAYNEAMAVAELRAERNDDLDELFEQLEPKAQTKPNANTGAADELAAIKAKLNKKD